MQLSDSPFERVDWSEVASVELADHWCTKGHVLLCLSGSLSTELGDGRVIELAPGDSYQMGDDSEPHRSSTTTGATLFIVD